MEFIFVLQTTDPTLRLTLLLLQLVKAQVERLATLTLHQLRSIHSRATESLMTWMTAKLWNIIEDNSTRREYMPGDNLTISGEQVLRNHLERSDHPARVSSIFTGRMRQLEDKMYIRDQTGLVHVILEHTPGIVNHMVHEITIITEVRRSLQNEVVSAIADPNALLDLYHVDENGRRLSGLLLIQTVEIHEENMSSIPNINTTLNLNGRLNIHLNGHDEAGNYGMIDRSYADATIIGISPPGIRTGDAVQHGSNGWQQQEEVAPSDAMYTMQLLRQMQAEIDKLRREIEEVQNTKVDIKSMKISDGDVLVVRFPREHTPEDIALSLMHIREEMPDVPIIGVPYSHNGVKFEKIVKDTVEKAIGEIHESNETVKSLKRDWFESGGHGRLARVLRGFGSGSKES